MSTVVPTPQQVQAMIETGPEGPIVMVNLLKYRAKAAYKADRAEAAQNLSGRDAYQRYGMVAIQHVTQRSGRVVWAGPQKLVFIGDAQANDWDDVVCVHYPSRKAFLEMTQDPAYLAAHYHRDAGLERTALLCCSAGAAA
ncbi:MAG TPA: DUF1330 domain-containing protein [Rhizomicrobium sp.]|jgi:uncharacterized protein (DUF1330 family)|nr:DUF1330 domain-containing protein [Rhizomicrobium sp.]